MPTILEAAGIPEPASVNGVAQKPIEGVSMALHLRRREGRQSDPHRRSTSRCSATAPSTTTAGSRPAATAGCRGRPPAAVDFDEDVWELYNVDDDFSESTDLAAKEPQKLKELQDLFWTEAGKYNVLPLDDRFIERANPAHAAEPDRGADDVHLLPGPSG